MNENKDLKSMRKSYAKAELSESSAGNNPLALFSTWFEEAAKASESEPNAMTLSTIGEDGYPNGRIVLLKAVVAGEFQFFTNYESKKGKELLKNPKAALTFFWPELERQVRIQGTISKISKTESESYFRERPRESQLGAHVSRQSTIIESRNELEIQFRNLEKEFKDKDIPIPEYWGGYNLYPISIEFWQGRVGRLHDRLLYTRDSKNETLWTRKRLSP
ncbi:MAG: pyridoxamine 5'-phosphate oxidase [Leptospira sp.]|jgi:pyridoxamine 5'-phosphate oxidase|nr:pyridoxamine 5'-phosphate oxidase [Leptospira sp.]